MDQNQASLVTLDITDPAVTDSAGRDLGPLAWVLEEIRKSLDHATKSLKRFAREVEAARGSNVADVDTSQLRIARQQLHQSAGAMEMVDLGAPARMLHAMEAVVQRYFQHPEQCNEDAVVKVERGGFALIEYLQAVLARRLVSSVALFPQYRDVQMLAGADRIHPADLWSMHWQWIDPALDLAPPPRGYDAQARNELDEAVLKIMKNGDAGAAAHLSDLCLGFAAAQTVLQPAAFWKICAAYFEALASRSIAIDVYVKRATSRVLLQCSTLARGDQDVSERLAQDLLFFCAQARPPQNPARSALAAVRRVYALARFAPVDYEARQFGLHDPALLLQARKRIEAAKESWSALSGGDRGKLRNVADQFHLVGESLLKLHPVSEPLAQALAGAADAVARSGRPPVTGLAMEVATAILYLEAAFEDMDLGERELGARTHQLATRIERVRGGSEPEPLELWMEELYRRVSDRHTMGTVVGELRTAMSELERTLDQYFRNPRENKVLRDAPGQFAQMRGVLSVLGLEQAAQAVLHMRDTVEQLLLRKVDAAEARDAGTFEKLGNNLGALGFLIDMLNYQPALAKKLFVYDEAAGELRPVMGRSAPAAESAAVPSSDQLISQELRSVVGDGVPDVTDTTLPARLDTLAARAALAEQPGLAQSAREAAAALSAQDSGAAADAMAHLAAAAAAPVEQAPPAPEPIVEEDDLQGIFLEEAREVMQSGEEAVAALGIDGRDLDQLTTLRRAFHTLKGSSRMVGLGEFGEAAWAMEQLLNTRLADQTPADEALCALSRDMLGGFGQWVQAIADHRDGNWRAASFVAAADAMRTDNRRLPLVLPDGETAGSAPEATSPAAQPPEPAPGGQPAGSEAFHTDTAPSRIDLPHIVVPEAEHLEAHTPQDSNSTPDWVLTRDASQASEPEPLPDLDLLLPAELFRETIPPMEPVESGTANHADVDPSSLLPAADMPPAPQEQADAGEGAPADSESVKVIGSLRIGIPLFNVFLNEADERSRQLATEAAEWAIESHRPLPDAPIALAHSLAGSSATVGFHALSELARSLEQAMLHVQWQGHGTPAQGRVFNEAAEDVRRLLHQFAAGFLKEPDKDVMLALHDVLAAQPSRPAPLQSATAAVSNVTPLARPRAPTAGIASARAAAAEKLDDIDAVDAVDPDLFPTFEDEANELLPQLGGALRQWSARPANAGARVEMLRALHTLKGSARLAGAMRLGEMAHRMESEVEQLAPAAGLPSSQLEPLLVRFDAMQAAFDQLRQHHAASESAAASHLPAATSLDKTLPDEAAGARASTIAPAAVIVPAPQRQSNNPVVRVRSQLLDRLLNQAGEVMIVRSRLESDIGQLRGALTELTGNLERLRRQLRDLELQADSQMQSRLAQAKESQQQFDPLEFDRFTRVQELTRMMAESVNDVATVQRSLQRAVEAAEDNLNAQAHQTREMQRDLLRTRMVEFDGASDRLYRVLRQAAKEAGRQVKLDIVGGAIEMDRGVLERMLPAFEHLLRNAAVHGIEDAAARTAQGKNPTGTVTITLHHAGNDVSVEFRDDGAGLDLDRIRAKARALGLASDGQPLSDAQAIDLVFTPGFSTAAQVSELAGRGIGMDVVRAEVAAVGGRIETSTQAGQGTCFKLVLPLTTAVTQVVMLRADDRLFGVPSSVVEMVRRVPVSELEQAYGRGSFDHGGDPVPLFWAGALLQSSGGSSAVQGKTASVVVLQSAGQRVALHVDEVLGNQEVVVKNLGPQLSRLPGLAGMTVLASGAAVLIYNPVALAAVYGEQALRLSAERRPPPKSAEPTAVAPMETPLVLVVDDSVTVRRVTQRLLQREGYRVALAVDGLQALQRLAEERPAVVLADIEMPRMDGFDLVRNIRADQQLRDLPVIMITSRIAEKHKELARQLGVNHYLGKPYSEEELLSLVRHYSAAEIEA
ncbi:MAG: Signal transduction histidine kinase CheA [Burkholderiaceae bacterium]|jgi:chemosensory pili system protein ChpA (sensor histidine kinase/response regulator)|nr:MAG: Signal transduction histidine kinase CheA [Burkholderiaceae bacterium]